MTAISPDVLAAFLAASSPAPVPPPSAPAGPSAPIAVMRVPGLFQVDGVIWSGSFRDFAALVLGDRRVVPRALGAKDGLKSPPSTPLFVCGVAEPPRRSGIYMREIHVAGLDLDKISHAAFDSIIEKIRSGGYEHFGYSTWSDARDAGLISARIFLPLDRPIRRPPDEVKACEDAVAYHQEAKAKAKARGAKALPKLPKVPFKEWDLFREGLDLFAGFQAESVVDEQTSDPCRAFYVPVTPIGATPWVVEYAPGTPLVVDEIVDLAARAARGRGGTRKAKAAAKAASASVRTFKRVDLENLAHELESRGAVVAETLERFVRCESYAPAGEGHAARLAVSAAVARYAPALDAEAEDVLDELWEALGPSFDVRGDDDEQWEDFITCLEGALEKVRAGGDPRWEPLIFGADPYEGWKPADHEKYVMPVLRGKIAVRTEDSGQTLVRISPEGEVAGGVTTMHVSAMLAPALKEILGPPPTRIVRDGVEYFMQHTPAEDLDVAPFLWPLDGPGLCLRRMPWDLRPAVDEGDISAWGEFLVRLSDPLAFMGWIWSVFERGHRGRDIMWLRGDGQDGKSAIFRVLKQITGMACASISDEQFRSNEKRFLSASLYGKRLVIYGDCKIPTFPVSSVAHSWSGGDVVPIEGKGLMPFQTTLNCRILVGANVEPVLTSKRSDQSRLLYLEVAKAQSNTIDWEELLIAQAPMFLEACKRVYPTVVKADGSIRTNRVAEEAVARLGDDGDERWTVLVDQFLVIDPHAEVQASRVWNLLEAKRIDAHGVRDFTAYLMRKHGVTKRRTTLCTMYKGVKIRDNVGF